VLKYSPEATVLMLRFFPATRRFVGIGGSIGGLLTSRLFPPCAISSIAD
jgi:hypothetical protein